MLTHDTFPVKDIYRTKILKLFCFIVIDLHWNLQIIKKGKGVMLTAM